MKLTPEAQMRTNANRWLEEMGSPLALAAIYDADPLQPRSDHCFLTCNPATVAQASEAMDRWDFMTKAKDHQPLGYASSIGGWRERRARWAAQLIHHRATDGREFFELDFDGSNPNWGVALALSHALFDWTWQKITGHKTDPFRVAKTRGWKAAEET